MRRHYLGIIIFFQLFIISISAQSPISSPLDSILSVFEIELNNDIDCAEAEAYVLSQHTDRTFQFFGFYNLSRIHSTLNTIQEEGRYVDSLSRLSLQLSRPIFQGITFLAKASLANKLAKRGKAIWFLGKSIELLEKTTYYRYRVMALRELAKINADVNNLDNAKKYYQQAIKIVIQNNDNHLLAHFYSEMSSFFEVFDATEAFLYLQKSDSLNHFVQDDFLKSINLLHWGDRFLAQDKITLALTVLEEGLYIAEELQYLNFIALFNFKIGTVYKEMKDFNTAILFFKESIEFAEQVNNKQLQKANFQYLTDIYKQIDKKLLVIEYLSALNQMEKEIFEDKEYLVAQRFTYKFESQKQQEKINALKRQNNLKKIEQQQLLLEKKQQKRMMILLLSLLILIVAFALITIYNLYQKNIKDELLAQKNKELHLTKIQEIETAAQLKTLNAILEGQEKERERIARDLHDSLGGTLSALQLHVQNLELPSDTQHIEMLLTKACTDVREISHNMMPVSLKKLGLHHAIQDDINNINNTKQIKATCHFFGKEKTLPLSTQLSIYRLVQEGINNALKHAKANSILVQLVYKENLLNIIVEDDGKGFEVNKINHSFGLNNMQNRIEHLNGKMNIDSRINYGTTVMFELGV